MSLIYCPECSAEISDKAVACPKCGNPMKKPAQMVAIRSWGYEYKSKATFWGWPVVHVAIGRNPETGKLMAAKGIIAIGQFAIGVITIAQFGIGFLFGFGQFVGGLITIGQFAAGILFGLGQFATGITAIGQFAIGKYVLAVIGYGEHVWSRKVKDPEAVEYFKNIYRTLLSLIGK